MTQDTLTADERYQKAAQQIRTARSTLADVSDKSLGDHLSLLALGVVEEHLTDKHQESSGREE